MAAAKSLQREPKIWTEDDTRALSWKVQRARRFPAKERQITGTTEEAWQLPFLYNRNELIACKPNKEQQAVLQRCLLQELSESPQLGGREKGVSALAEESALG